MTTYLDLGDVLAVARAVLKSEPVVRDVGLLEAAVGRPRTTLFGRDAYPTLAEKGAALLHSLVANHSLLDGNKRVGVVAMILFFQLNGRRVAMSDDDLYSLTMSIASGTLSDVATIAARIDHELQ